MYLTLPFLSEEYQNVVGYWFPKWKVERETLHTKHGMQLDSAKVNKTNENML